MVRRVKSFKAGYVVSDSNLAPTATLHDAVSYTHLDVYKRQLMNFDMVKKLVAYCREQEKIHNKNFRFTMTTNGCLLYTSRCV